MKLNEIKAAPGFENLMPKFSIEEEDKREANLLMFKFLSIIEDKTRGRVSRKKLAELIGTSAANVTQLFRGNRLINLLTLAKLERVLDLEFEISLSRKVEEKKTEILEGVKFLPINAYQSIGNDIENSRMSKEDFNRVMESAYIFKASNIDSENRTIHITPSISLTKQYQNVNKVAAF